MKIAKLECIPKNVLDYLPSEVLRLVESADVYDSSCSPEACVYFIDSDSGYFLKAAATGTLQKEALMDDYFHKKGIGPEVLYYKRGDFDILLSSKIVGEDCTAPKYLDNPERLAVRIAEELRKLHEIDFSACPIDNKMSDYFTLARENYKRGTYDKSHFPNSFGYRCAEEAYAVMENGLDTLSESVLLHGDFCLPNIILDDWRLSGYIDLGGAGVGDRHIDIFWGEWTLGFNTGTNRYSDLFLDAYGRDKVDLDKLRTVAAAEVFG